MGVGVGVGLGEAVFEGLGVGVGDGVLLAAGELSCVTGALGLNSRFPLPHSSANRSSATFSLGSIDRLHLDFT